MRALVGLAAVVGLGAVALAACSGPVGAHPARDPGDALGQRIEAAIKAGGPFFTAAERATIERKCGYPAGSFDGFEVNVVNGALTCKDGKRVDDAEMRALLAVAEPRIGRRISAVMASAEVQGAIRAVAEEAQREALAGIDHAGIAREAAMAAREAVREAQLEMRDAAREAAREARRGR